MWLNRNRASKYTPTVSWRGRTSNVLIAKMLMIDCVLVLYSSMLTLKCIVLTPPLCSQALSAFKSTFTGWWSPASTTYVASNSQRGTTLLASGTSGTCWCTGATAPRVWSTCCCRPTGWASWDQTQCHSAILWFIQVLKENSRPFHSFEALCFLLCSLGGVR